MNQNYKAETQSLQNQEQESGLSLPFHRDNRNLSRGKQIASTILLIFAGVLLYADNFLDFGLDLNQPVPNFLILKNFIYAMEMSVAPIIIIFATRMKPFNLAYLVPLYAYMNMLIGNIILLYGYQIFDLWWYRLLIAATVIPVYVVLTRTIKYYEAKERKEKAKDRLIQNYQSQYDQE